MSSNLFSLDSHRVEVGVASLDFDGHIPTEEGQERRQERHHIHIHHFLLFLSSLAIRGQIKEKNKSKPNVVLFPPLVLKNSSGLELCLNRASV